MSSKACVNQLHELLQHFLKYGPNTRQCLALLKDSWAEINHESEVNAVISRLSEATPWLPDPDGFEASDVISHLCMPANQLISGEIVLNSTVYSYPTSPYIAKRLMEWGIEKSTVNRGSLKCTKH